MHKIVKLFVVPMMCLAANFASAANIKDYPTVAVMDFGNKAITSHGLRGHDMTMATEYAIYQLSACGWFDLIDYEQLSTIAKMHSINMSGLIDQGSAVQMGKISGAQFMVIGNVTGLTTKENVAGLRAHNANLNNAQHVVNANVAVRIVDVETGRVVAAGIGKGSSTSTMTEVGFTKFRNRKVETENVYNSVANTLIDEYNQNKVNSSNKETDYNINTHTVNDQYYNNHNFTQSEVEHSEEYNQQNGNSVKIQNINSQDSTEEISNISDYNINNKYGDGNGQKVEFVCIEGDVNEDGQIDDMDFKFFYNYFMDDEQLFRRSYKFNDQYADIDGDGKITTKDLWRLKLITNELYDMQRLLFKEENNSIKKTNNGWDYVSRYTPKELKKILQEYISGKRNVYVEVLSLDVNHDGRIDNSDIRVLDDQINLGYEKVKLHIPYFDISSKYAEYNKTHGMKYVKDDKEILTNKVNTNENISNKKISKANNDEKLEENEIKRQDEKLMSDSSYTKEISETTVNLKALSDIDNNYSESSKTSENNNENIDRANNSNTFSSSSKNIYYEREAENYSIVIGTVEVSDVQVRNAISKAVRDAIYGNTGIMTTLNNGKKLKIKTGF